LLETRKLFVDLIYEGAYQRSLAGTTKVIEIFDSAPRLKLKIYLLFYDREV